MNSRENLEEFSDKLKNVTLSEYPITYDETCNSGLMINDKYIPEELLSNYVWRKKAEMIVGRKLPADENSPWTTYYLICDKKPFYKNLIKNDSTDKFDNWMIIDGGGDGWKIESPPVGVPPLPEDPIFNGRNACFVTSYNYCSKYQIINLIEEGFSEYLLDNWQPVIKISEYYSCRWDCPATYECRIQLFNDKEVLDCYGYSKDLVNEEQNEWFKLEYEFKNYGKGLRKIVFIHGGQDKCFWAGHYGSKMAGTCIKLELPEFHQSID